ncbi:hypothetical protein [Nereida sp. MMG025]|uniref:hypothetical protein n=1 Tax=Nereida sp. MMG025 TaxID=2909981 RepID=UPI001F437EC4|nr:hypothetical protein [Nereida sp. MMG025]MCF6445728.1 hypothetical protein [Nereida sp. MMG025]
MTDVVRCWNVTGEIGNLGDNVLPIHLVRSVQGWVQAQLLPTGPRRLRKRLFDIYREFSFFRRRGHFDNYHYQSIIDTALAERHAVWQHSNLSIEELKGAPAYVKLMAFWWGANLVSHAKLRGSNALLVTLEEFSEAPSKILSEVLDATSWTRHDFSTGQVRSVRAAHRSNATAWKKAGDAIGIPVELISGEPIGGQAMAAIFDKALDEAAR